MAIVTQERSRTMQRTGETLPAYQAPLPVPSKGEPLASGQTCPWYKSAVYTDTQGGLYELPIGCATNNTLIGGLVAALAFGAWWFMGRKA